MASRAPCSPWCPRRSIPARVVSIAWPTNMASRTPWMGHGRLRPMALTRERGGTHAPTRGSGRRAPRAAARYPHGGGQLPALGHGDRRGPRPAPCARPGAQGPEAGPSAGELRGRTGPAHRVRPRLASAARAAGARAARIHRRHACLYGTRTDRADEPFDQLPQRLICPRCRALRDAHRHTAVYRLRSHGVGPLPHRQKADTACRAAEGRSGRRLGRSS